MQKFAIVSHFLECATKKIHVYFELDLTFFAVCYLVNIFSLLSSSIDT